MPVLEYSPHEELLQQARSYDSEWAAEVDEENLGEDEDFFYIELKVEEDIRDDFMEFGSYLEARSTAEVNNGERYILSVEK